VAEQHTAKNETTTLGDRELGKKGVDFFKNTI
jgi:hypothetical protein